MNRKPGRPPAKVRRDSGLELRVSADEKEAFELAAAMAGISLSSWVRERLRLAAIRELESAGRRVPFVPEIKIGDQYGRS